MNFALITDWRIFFVVSRSHDNEASGAVVIFVCIRNVTSFNLVARKSDTIFAAVSIALGTILQTAFGECCSTGIPLGTSPTVLFPRFFIVWKLASSASIFPVRPMDFIADIVTDTAEEGTCLGTVLSAFENRISMPTSRAEGKVKAFSNLFHGRGGGCEGWIVLCRN